MKQKNVVVEDKSVKEYIRNWSTVKWLLVGAIIGVIMILILGYFTLRKYNIQ